MLWAFLTLSLVFSLTGQASADLYNSREELKAYPEQAIQLPYRQRLSVYEDLSMDPRGAMWVNVLPFGLGSFFQGDYTGGLTLAALDLAALGIATQGSRFNISPLWSVPIYASGRVVGFFSPLNHAREENKAMAHLLDIEAPEHVLFAWPFWNIQLSF